MAQDNNNSVNNNTSDLSNSENEQTFVGKVRSHVSGLLNKNLLTKWFSTSKSTIRKREDVIAEYDNTYEENELTSILEPPMKRAKYPKTQTSYDTYSESTNIYQSTPITFNNMPEPIAGPSGIQQQQQSRQFYNKGKLFNSASAIGENNKGGSDSEESTSGYSSTVRVGSKEKIIENHDISDHYKSFNRSLFNSPADSRHNLFSQRSLLSNSSNTSLSKRRPNFNSSTFGTKDFMDSSLATQRILNSPFYSGNTTFGGALAQKRKFGQTVKNSLKIQPVNSNNDNSSNNEKLINNEITTLSKTARRILNTIEQYSTPISDAKKIPILPSKETLSTTSATTTRRNEGVLTKYIGYKPYLIENRRNNNKNQSVITNNKELQIPNLIQMKQKERLQNTTELIRDITTKSLKDDESQLNGNKQNDYKLNDNKGNNTKTYVSKMKSSRSARQKTQLNDNYIVNEPVNLPKISLPITELPKFDLNSIPLIKNTNNDNKINTNNDKIIKDEKKEQLENSNNKIIIKENKIIKEKDKLVEFKFSKPLIITNENLESVMAINDFKFSEPLNKKCNNNNKMNGEIVMKMFKSTNSSTNSFGKFGPVEWESTWECQVCLIRNKLDKLQCVACEAPKPKKIIGLPPGINNNKKNDNSSSGFISGNNTLSTSLSNFGDKFKPSTDTWECSVCMIRNKNDANKCVACETPKSNKVITSSTAFKYKTKNDSSSNNTLSTVSNFDDKFKPSTDTWECQVCMIRNKNDVSKCVACEAPNNNKSKLSNSNNLLTNTLKCTKCSKENKNELNKCDNCEKLSTNLFNKFKPPDNLWKCETCLLMNKNELDKCIACETPKLKQENNNNKSNQWECPTCYVKNSISNLSCVCCSHLRSSTTTPVTTTNDLNKSNNKISSFNFGIDKSGVDLNEQKNTVKSNINFTFGSNNKSNAQLSNEIFKPAISTTSLFKSPSSSTLNSTTKKVDEQKTTSTPQGFKFNVKSSLKFPLTDNNSLEQKTMIKTTTETIQPTINSLTTQSPIANKLIESSNIEKNDLKTTNQIKENIITKDTTTTNMTFNFVPMKSLNDNKLNEENKNIFKFGSNSSISAATTTTSTLSNSIIGTETTIEQNNSFHLLKDTNTNIQTPVISNDVSIIPISNNDNKSDNKLFTFGNSSTQLNKTTSTFSFNELSKSKSMPFKFGESSNVSGGFNFAPSSTSTTSTPMFNFNSNNENDNKAKPGLLFNNPPSTNNIFGTPSSSTSTSSSAMKNGGKIFNFGSMTNTTNNNQKAGFSFGAIAQQTPDNTNQLNSIIGLNNSTDQQQSGFNFSGNVTTPATGGFNFNSSITQPIFNFTDGNVPTFSNPPTGTGQQRKIRKALRRTTPR